MLTVILVAAAAVLIIGLVLLATKSGTQNKRHSQSGSEAVTKQEAQPRSPRAQSSNSSAAND